MASSAPATATSPRALHGLRVRGFVQDDGHIFCTEEQILRSASPTALLQKVYRDFGFTDIIYKVATRPAKRIGSDEAWDRPSRRSRLAGKIRRRFSVSPGEGAFYGPKIEYSLKDGIGRVWQCGTMQVDFSMPDGSAPNTSPRTTRGARR